jgi:nucleotide-binding universal stress UspA family protein
MKILVGTDFSPAAQAAADAATALASATGSRLTLVHVHRDLTLPDLPDFAVQAAEFARESLRAEAERLRKSGLVVDTEFVSGSPGRGLLGAAAKHNAELLLVGSDPAKSTGDRWLMGDVAEYVAEHANVPTLVVRNARPIVEWALKHEPLKILVGEDLQESSGHPLLWVKSLSGIAPCHTTVAYVMWPYEQSLRYGYALPHSYFDVSPEVVGLAERDLKRRIGLLMGDLPVDAVVEPSWGAADGPLAELTKERGTGLMVVGSRQHRRFSRFLEHSVSRAVIRDFSVNLAIIPSEATPGNLAPVRRFERVLIPTDFSVAGNHAIPFGYSMVPPGGVVCLAHICEKGQLRVAETESRLRDLIPPESQKFGIRTEVMVEEDNAAWSGIVHLANRSGSDAICMANHGRSELGDAFLKSTTREVLRQARVPVLVVHGAKG